MSKKTKEPHMKIKCWFCGGYHTATFKDIVILIAIVILYGVILILRLCGKL